MKKILMVSLFVVSTLFLSACSNKVPDARDNLSDVDIKAGDESVPQSEHSVRSSYKGDIAIDSGEFKERNSILINGNEFTLGKSKINDFEKVFGLKPVFDEDLGCFLLQNENFDNSIMAMLHADTKSKIINRIVICNMDKDSNLLTFDYGNVTDTSSPDEAEETIGQPSVFADSLNTKNRQWDFEDSKTKQHVSFQIIWSGDMVSEVNLSM